MVNFCTVLQATDVFLTFDNNRDIIFKNVIEHGFSGNKCFTAYWTKAVGQMQHVAALQR